MKLVTTKIVDGRPVVKDVQLPRDTPPTGLQKLADVFNSFARRPGDATYKVVDHG